MFKAIPFALIWLVISCNNSFADILKCVNKQGAVVFTNTGQCLEGYAIESIRPESKRVEPVGNPASGSGPAGEGTASSTDPLKPANPAAPSPLDGATIIKTGEKYPGSSAAATDPITGQRAPLRQP